MVTSSTVGGDDGGFLLSLTFSIRTRRAAMLVGTCRVWRGAPRTGRHITALSPNFETLGSGTCTGNEVNQDARAGYGRTRAEQQRFQRDLCDDQRTRSLGWT